MVNTLLASAIAGGIGILAASITQLDTETLPLQIVPALAAALIAGFTSFGIACAAGIGLGIIGSLIEYVTRLSWFPTAGGVALAGRVRARRVRPDRAVHVPARRAACRAVGSSSSSACPRRRVPASWP